MVIKSIGDNDLPIPPANAASFGTHATQVGAASATSSGKTGTIADVKHVIILMQENRSFDHYFGMLKGVRGFADRSTIFLPGLQSVFNQPKDATRQYPFPLRAPSGNTFANAEMIAQCQGNADHSWPTQHTAWNHGKMDQWWLAKQKIGTLGYLDRYDLPFYYGLADAYTICDAYYSSGLTATGPNRTFLWSGMIDAAGKYGPIGQAKDGGEEKNLTWPTYAQALETAGVSWRVYQVVGDNYNDNALAYFTQFENAPDGSPLKEKGMRSVPHIANNTTARDLAAAITEDARNATLPQVSWIVTDELTSEHPPCSPVNGANFIYDLLVALATNPEVLNSTVVFVCYDENDGFFDHVPPPIPPAGTPDEFIDGVPVGLGFRVPMLVLSPWSRGGWVASETFDHTSVIQFIETWTEAIGKKAPCENISAWRRSVCGNLTSAFDFTAPVYGLPVRVRPGPVISAAACSTQPNQSPQTNALPLQEQGSSPARALPYQPNAWVSSLTFADANIIQIHITMTNEDSLATKASTFAIYTNQYVNRAPWQYTVPAHKASEPASITDYFNVGAGYGDGKYDLTVVGPNRFLRRFRGDAHAAGKNLEVIPSYSANGAGKGTLAIWFEMQNKSEGDVIFTVTSNNYRSEGPWLYTIGAGKSVKDYFNAVYYASGWYDFTITVNVDSSWLRQFIGHIETGQPSVTG